jgi:hypothetical protein
MWEGNPKPISEPATQTAARRGCGPVQRLRAVLCRILGGLAAIVPQAPRGVSDRSTTARPLLQQIHQLGRDSDSFARRR